MEMLDGVEMPQGFGMTDMATIKSLSGLEYLRGIAEGKYAGPNIGRALQFRMLEVGGGTCTFTGVPTEHYLNPMGVIHGGYIATLLDSALACCVQTLCPAGYASTSVEALCAWNADLFGFQIARLSRTRAALNRTLSDWEMDNRSK